MEYCGAEDLIASKRVGCLTAMEVLHPGKDEGGEF